MILSLSLPPRKVTSRLLLALLILMSNIHLQAQTTLLWNEGNGATISNEVSVVSTDLLGNIYVASTTSNNGNTDWLITSFAPDSILRWTTTISGSANENDFPVAIVVDSLFGVYVAGTTSTGNGRDIALTKLDSAGNVTWSNDYDRMNSSDDVCTGMEVVAEGIVLVGNSNLNGGKYDYSCLLYNVDGILEWSRHFNSAGNLDDFASGVALKVNKDICITGNSVATNGISEMLTVCYDWTGNLKWSATYSYKNGYSDYAHDIGVNSAQDVIVIGQGYASATNSDAIVLKYGGGDGLQKWVTAYAGTTGGVDLARCLVMDAGNYFFVTGTTQIAGNNSDYFIIKYRGNGQITWAQTYNGSADSFDEAKAIISDGEDIVVTGNSTGSSSGLDATTISINKGSGAINWIYRLNGNVSISDRAFNLCRDEMGNILVAGNAQIQTNSFVNTIFKINQAEKNELAIEEHLRMLGIGMVAIAEDTMSKRILYDYANLVLDSFYAVNVNTFLARCDNAGSNARNQVREELANAYGWNLDCAAEEILSSRIRQGLARRASFIYIPAYSSYTRTQFILNLLTLSFCYSQLDFPIYSLPALDPILEQDVLSTPTAILITRPVLFWNKNSPGLRYCYAMRNDDVFNNCSVCGGYSALDGLPSATSCGSTQGHEVGIDIGYNYWGSCNVQGGVEECVRQIDMNTGAEVTSYPQYALLQAMPGFQYFERIGSGNYIKVKKMTYPIFDVGQQQYGVSMTLCGGDNGASFKKFNDYHGGNPGDYTEDFALGWGGIYKVSRPGTGQRPVYFTLPFAKYLRYSQGPDLNFVFGTNVLNSCTNGRKEIAEDYFISSCEICYATQTVFGLNQNSMADILITTDYQSISSFWQDNVITVGVHNTSAFVDPSNFVTFSATNPTTSCAPTSYNLASSTPVCTLSVLSDNTYEVRNLFTGNQLFQPGSQLLVHVRAGFLNGETINTCQIITLASTQTNLAGVTVEIRGNINDYSPSVINYQVDIYELQ